MSRHPQTAKDLRRLAALLLFLFIAALPAWGQTKIKPPRNFFGVETDVELGREAASEYERELKPFYDEEVSGYVGRVGRRLIAALPEQYRRKQFAYVFKVVDDKELNAFALPGGHVYVNRGLVEGSASEGELAAVLAHEISHVALRHGTAQASKALLAQIGLAVLSEALGDSKKAQAVELGGYAALGLYMMKFSRDYEKQADILGAQIMSRAGYDPREMVALFRKFEQEGGSGLPQWLSDHPSHRNRAARITEEAGMLTVVERRSGEESELSRIQARLRTMPDARSRTQRAQRSLQALNR